MHAHRIGDVLHLLRAEVLELELELALDLVEDVVGDARSRPARQCFEARRHVHCVAVEALALRARLTEVHADAELHPAPLWNRGVARADHALDLGGGQDGVGRSGEFREQVVARSVDDALGCSRIKAPITSRYAVGLQPSRPRPRP
jgi:hypothetical protein